MPQGRNFEEKKGHNDQSPAMLSEDGMVASYKSPLFMANLLVFQRD